MSAALDILPNVSVSFSVAAPIPKQPGFHLWSLQPKKKGSLNVSFFWCQV